MNTLTIINDPAKIVEIKSEELVQIYENTLNTIDELLAQKEAIKQEFDARLQADKQDSKEIAGWGVTRFQKIYSSGVTLETARKFGATKTEEKVNTTIITKLVKAGTEIEGAEIRHEIRIAKLKEQGGEVTA